MKYNLVWSLYQKALKRIELLEKQLEKNCPKKRKKKTNNIKENN